MFKTVKSKEKGRESGERREKPRVAERGAVVHVREREGEREGDSIRFSMRFLHESYSSSSPLANPTNLKQNGCLFGELFQFKD